MGHYDSCYENDEEEKRKVIPCPVCKSENIGEAESGKEYCRNCGVVLYHDRKNIRGRKN